MKDGGNTQYPSNWKDDEMVEGKQRKRICPCILQLPFISNNIILII